MSSKSKKPASKSAIPAADVTGTSYAAGTSFNAACAAVAHAIKTERRKYDDVRNESIAGRLASTFYAGLSQADAVAKAKGLMGAEGWKEGKEATPGKAMRTQSMEKAYGAARSWFSYLCRPENADVEAPSAKGKGRKGKGKAKARQTDKPAETAAPAAPAAREPVSFTALTSKGKGKTVTVDHVSDRGQASAGLLNLAKLAETFCKENAKTVGVKRAALVADFIKGLLACDAEDAKPATKAA